jgi:hypothetical protein
MTTEALEYSNSNEPQPHTGKYATEPQQTAFAFAFDLAFALDLDLALDRALDRARALDLARALGLDLDLALDRALARARALALDLDLALDLALDGALDRARALALARALDVDALRDLRAKLDALIIKADEAGMSVTGDRVQCARGYLDELIKLATA